VRPGFHSTPHAGAAANMGGCNLVAEYDWPLATMSFSVRQRFHLLFDFSLCERKNRTTDNMFLHPTAIYNLQSTIYNLQSHKIPLAHWKEML
jgi:hypothetical protein